MPLPDASTCKNILHRFGYNNETARDPHKKNLQYADGRLLEFIWTEGYSGRSYNPGLALAILVL